MIKNLKIVMFTAIVCFIFTSLFAQFDYLQAARDKLLKGDCEKAQKLYNVYKQIENKTNYELER